MTGYDEAMISHHAICAGQVPATTVAQLPSLSIIADIPSYPHKSSCPHELQIARRTQVDHPETTGKTGPHKSSSCGENRF